MKMNKSELKEQVVNLSIKIDSLMKENLTLQEDKRGLSQDVSLLGKTNEKNNFEIIRLTNLNRNYIKKQVENDSIVSENDKLIYSLNQKIKALNDSISNLKITSIDDYSSNNPNKNDFLNNYFFNQVPLNNNNFELVLSKIIYLSIGKNQNIDYNQNEKDEVGFFRGIKNDGSTDYDEIDYNLVNRYNYNFNFRHDIPELLEPNQFTYYRVKPNVLLSSGTTINDYLILGKSDFFNLKLPKIEILKNKLFTFKYFNGDEESFLFNVKILPESQNNQRKIMQLELANEEVKADGTNNTAKDIVWRFYAIENECYLALSHSQLWRIDLKLNDLGNGLEVISKDNQINYINNFRNDNYYSYKTTGDGMFLSRNKDIFMSEANYVNPMDLIYLFKLKQL